MGNAVEVRHLAPDAITLIGEIDRSERVEVEYVVADGELVSRQVEIEVPSWRRTGEGEHSVADLIATWEPVVTRGADLLGAFDGSTLLGLAIVDAGFAPGVTWLAFLHVGRPHRRHGVASALWAECVALARAAGDRSIYVSATPTGSAVGFYRSRGCVLAAPPHPDLLEKEPDDVHLLCPVR